MKLKTHFKDTASHQHLIEEEILKKSSNKSWIPPKNHHRVEICIEATDNDIDAVTKKLKDQSILTFLKGRKSTRRIKSERWHHNHQRR